MNAYALSTGDVDFLDKVSAPTLRAREEPHLTIDVRQLEHLTEQIPFLRFLESQ